VAHIFDLNALNEDKIVHQTRVPKLFQQLTCCVMHFDNYYSNYHAKIGDGDRDCGVFPLCSERILRHVGTFLGGPHAQSGLKL